MFCLVLFWKVVQEEGQPVPPEPELSDMAEPKALTASSGGGRAPVTLTRAATTCPTCGPVSFLPEVAVSGSVSWIKFLGEQGWLVGFSFMWRTKFMTLNLSTHNCIFLISPLILTPLVQGTSKTCSVAVEPESLARP